MDRKTCEGYCVVVRDQLCKGIDNRSDFDNETSKYKLYNHQSDARDFCIRAEVSELSTVASET